MTKRLVRAWRRLRRRREFRFAGAGPDEAAVLEAAAETLRACNAECAIFDAETPVEDWALDALAAALSGDGGRARELIGRYAAARWDASEDGGASEHYRSEYPLRHAEAQAPPPGGA